MKIVIFVYSTVFTVGLRKYIFTDRDRERLRRWLETGEEDDSTRNLFVLVRRGLPRLSSDLDLLVRASKKLRKENRFDIRMTLPKEMGRIVKKLKNLKP